ncbi:MAG: MATE family efflux transporter [Oscillospiraceae bacterium]|nr:MATE family efflux transporter [Oscillospiraceae bacterium]
MNNSSGDKIEKSELMFDKRYLLRLIIPLIIDQMLALTVGLIDTMMVASAGESAVSGVSVVESINILLIGLFASFAAGGAVVAGQYLGKGERENAKQAAKQLVTSTTLFALVISALCLALNKPVLSLLFGSIEPAVMDSAQGYFYATAASFPFIALFSSSAALFRNMGNSRLAMMNAIVMNILNLTGNAVFIYVFRLGAFGAGLATLIARMVAALCMMKTLRNPFLDIHVRSYGLKGTDMQMTKRILKIGVPGGLETSFFQFGKIILTRLTVTMGTAAIAANAVAGSIAGVAVIPGSALGLALTSVVAQCAGANKYDQANHYIKFFMKLVFTFMTFSNASILLFGKSILGLYRLSPETFDIALTLVVAHGIFAALFWPLAFTLPNIFRASGDVRFPLIVSISTMCVCRIAFSYIFAYFGLGVLGIWLAMILDWIVRALFFVRRLFGNKWQNFKVI